MDLEAKPLKKEIFDKAKKLGIAEIQLEFLGGSDEGWVQVNCTHHDVSTVAGGIGFPEFEQEIEEWVWQVYDYSGAGDGSAYGDDIVYDLEKNTVHCSDWYMARQEGKEMKFPLELEFEIKDSNETGNSNDLLINLRRNLMSKTIMYGGKPYTVLDYGQRCVYCGEDTSFGSGNFVNRVGADNFDEETKEYRDGYGCPSCMALDCDRCDEKIGIDEDYSPHDVYGDNDPGEFSDGSYRVCEDCLTKEEKQLAEENNE